MKDDVKAAFKVFDHNNDGSISRSKLLLIIVESDEGDDFKIKTNLILPMHREELREAMVNFGTRCTDE